MKSFIIVTLQIFALVCLFGVWIAPITRSIDPAVDDLVVLFGRFSYASVLVVVGAKLMSRLDKKKYYPEKIRNLTRRKNFVYVLLAGFYLAVSYFAYTRSFRLSSHLAPALSMGNVSIVWVIIFSFRKAWRETPLTMSTALGLLMATCTLLIPGEAGGVNAATAWGLVASFFLALYLIKSQQLPRQAPSYAVVAWYCLVGAAMGFLGLMAAVSLDNNEFINVLLRPQFHLKMLGLGAGTALAFFIYTWVLQRVSPLIVSAFLVLTPAANSLMDKLMSSETKITPTQITGVIIVSLLLLVLYVAKAYEDQAKQQRE